MAVSIVETSFSPGSQMYSLRGIYRIIALGCRVQSARENESSFIFVIERKDRTAGERRHDWFKVPSTVLVLRLSAKYESEY